MKYEKTHELYKHDHICLIEDHYNPLGIVRSLGEAGIVPIILLCNPNPILVNYSKYAKKLFTFDTIEDAFFYMTRNYSNKEYKPFVYNGSDNITLFLDKHYIELKDKFYFFNGQGGIEKYLQKYDITLLAEECGCKIPKERLMKKGELPKDLNYPIITKAVTSSNGGDWKAESFICENEYELINAYQEIQSDYILIQEYIRKKNEYCIDGISINAGEDVFLPYAAQYFRFSPKSYGAYMWFEQIANEELIKRIKEIIRKSKYTGVFCIEFLIGQDDELYFLEVNYRNSGWSYAFTYGGFNLLYMWAKSTIDNSIIFDKSDLLTNKFTAMSEFEDLQIFRKELGGSIPRWIGDFRKADCKFLYNRQDPMPFIMILIRGVFNKTIRFFAHRVGKTWKGK